jgi:Smg protein
MAVSLNCRAAAISASTDMIASPTEGMFDIFVYLFENYRPEAFPEPDVLARKLSAAGFEDDDISAALTWLDGLSDVEHDLPPASSHPSSLRVFDAAEESKLATEARGFLIFLEHAEAIDGMLREAIIERAMALPDRSVSLDKIKIIVLMVMWRRHQPLDALLLEELLAEDEGEPGDHH